MAGKIADRINARLDADLVRKLERARALTHKSVTDIVRESLDRYCDEVLVARDSGTTRDRLQAAGFIGCAAGPADLSTRYKQALTDSLARKT